MATIKYCPRCGKTGIRTDSATEEIWNCPALHGVIYRAPLPAAPPPAKAESETAPEPAAAAPAEPESDGSQDEPDEEKNKEKAQTKRHVTAPPAESKPWTKKK